MAKLTMRAAKLNMLIEEKGYRTIEVIRPEKNAFSLMRDDETAALTEYLHLLSRIEAITGRGRRLRSSRQKARMENSECERSRKTAKSCEINPCGRIPAK
jgi:hypothetical protein